MKYKHGIIIVWEAETWKEILQYFVQKLVAEENFP